MWGAVSTRPVTTGTMAKAGKGILPRRAPRQDGCGPLAELSLAYLLGATPPGNTTGLSLPSRATDATPKR